MKKVLCAMALMWAFFAYGATAVNNYCSSDSGVTWAPCPAPSASGATQDVNIKNVGGTAVTTGAGATAAGSERVTVAQDSTTIAGSSTGTAGTPSARVVSVQGVASGTNLPVSGAVADAVAATGNPVPAGAIYESSLPTYTTGQRSSLHTGTRGSLRVELFGSDTTTGVNANVTNADNVSGGNGGLVTQSRNYLWDGSTWDLGRSIDGATNGTTGTGLQAGVRYGEYTGNATQPAITTGQFARAQIDPAGNLRTAPQRPTATDILDGRQTFTSTTGATTVITVSAGRTWVGTLGSSVSCNEAAAGTAACTATATFTTAGTNVVPSAGTYFVCSATGGANGAAGLTGSQGNSYCSIPFTVVAPAGNSVTVQVASTNAGTTSLVEAFAVGVMQ